jgi:hypothetical protein
LVEHFINFTNCSIKEKGRKRIFRIEVGSAEVTETFLKPAKPYWQTVLQQQ